jgi:glycosyltransferase involved in cell wall biosynthesis
MRPLRIVLVFMEPPNPFGNAGARWFYVLFRELVQRGHKVTVFSGGSKMADIEQSRALFSGERWDLRCYSPPPLPRWRGTLQTVARPFSYPFSEEMQRDLKRELDLGFDVLHLEQVWSGWLGLPWAERALLNIHFSMQIDSSETPPQGLRQRVMRNRILASERKLLRSYRWISSLTPRLTEYVQGVNPQARALTAPFGLDCSLYPFVLPEQPEENPTVGLIGSFDWTPTYLAGRRLIDSLWPKIRSARPDARLCLVGRSASRAFGAYAGRDGIEVAQDVDDVVPYFHRCSVMLYAPRVGTGMKIKVLEAFALGVPVVTNAEGIEGLPAESGVHAEIHEEDSGLVSGTLELLANRSKARRMSVAARALVESVCSPQATVDRVEDIYGLMLGLPDTSAVNAEPSDEVGIGCR